MMKVLLQCSLKQKQDEKELKSFFKGFTIGLDVNKDALKRAKSTREIILISVSLNS
jgi:hypothetical protein